MVDLSQHKVSDLVQAINLIGRWVEIDEKSSMGLAVKEPQKPTRSDTSQQGSSCGKGYWSNNTRP